MGCASTKEFNGVSDPAKAPCAVKISQQRLDAAQSFANKNQAARSAAHVERKNSLRSSVRNRVD